MHPNRWALGLGLLLVATAAGLISWFFLVGLHSGGMTAAQAEALAASLPMGSTREEVEAFLNARGITPGFIDRKDPNYLSWMVSVSGLEEQQLGGAIQAWIPDANLDPWFSGEIFLYFFLGRNGLLIKRVVNPLIHNF